jgi:2-keto-4-pentenoate hydratase
VSVERGTRALLTRRREQLAQGAEPLGWKIGFNVPEIQERLRLDRPLAGYLSSDGLLADGATWSLGDGGPVVVESELAVELGADARSIAALLPALELADPPDLTQDLETILAGNIFHRAVAFGPRVEAGRPGVARILVNGEERHAIDAERAGGRLEAMVEVVAERLAAADERPAPGERIITGVLAPPHPAEPGDVVRLEVEGLGGVELRFAE